MKKEQARTSTLNSSDITNTTPKTQPMAPTISNTGHSFSGNQTTQAAHQTVDQQGPKKCHLSPGDWAQSWDIFIQLTPGYGHLSAESPGTPIWGTEKSL